VTCPDCERYKESARNWRHKAYELSGRPLPWEGGDTWVGLTDEERLALWSGLECDLECLKPAQYAEAIEQVLREKNS